MLTYFVIGCYIAAVSALLSGLIVYFGNRAEKINKIYLWFSFIIVWWGVSLGLAAVQLNHEASLFMFRVEHVAVVFIPTVYLHFVFNLIGLEHKYKKIIYITYAYSVVLLLMNFTDLVIKSVSPKFYFPYYKNPGLASPLVLLLYCFSICYGIYLLIKTSIKLEAPVL